MREKFYCTAVSWYFARPFLYEKVSDYDKSNLPKTNSTLSIKLVLLGILFAISATITGRLGLEKIGMILAILMFFSFFLFFIRERKIKVSIYKDIINATVLPEKNDSPLLYILQDDGIWINYLNSSEGYGLFLSWDSINSGYIGRTIINYIAHSEKLKANGFDKYIFEESFELAKENLDDFPYEVKEKYNEHISLFLQQDHERPFQLPIPNAWFYNGEYERFINLLVRQSGINVKNLRK
ncbi:hypothetical protein [Salirhabdus salicampi]|uniref:hypothetical protein n=1 Tax=Salirhabdus salicampi TaxID=476102 RepID=UPI0020C32119|nr:hypothetical protein [Salirhabdus salicampi]MCP8617277.1 hypothetical protein [Salirhabdus salicampi]